MLFTIEAKILSDGQFFVPIKKKWIEQKGLSWDRLNGLSFCKGIQHLYKATNERKFRPQKCLPLKHVMIPIVKATREFDHTKDITFIKCHEITYTELLLCMQSKFTVKYYLYLSRD